MKKKKILYFLLAILLLIRFLYFYAQPDLCTDHISQMAMAQNFIEGHGFSFKYLNSQTEIYYKTHIQWPPLYPLVLALISIVTSNMLFSSLIIQIVVLVLLVFTWKKVFDLFADLISEDAYFFFIALLMVSTSILNNINTILVFAILILSISNYFLFAFLLKNKQKKSDLFLSSFFASLLFWTHYSYFFVAFYPAVVLIILFYLRKEKFYLLTGLSSFVISLVFSLGVLFYNFFTTGFINYMDNPAIWNAGFFPQHLLLTDPFSLNAFFKTAYLLDDFFSKNYQILAQIIFQVISFIILITIVLLYLKLRKDNASFSKRISLLFIPFFVITILTISFLLYFTLHYHEIPRPGWTHLGDARYLSPVYLSIIAIVILLVFIKVDYLNRTFLIFVKTILILMIFMNSAINTYIIFKEWGNYSYRPDTYKVPEKDLQTLFDSIKFELSKGNLPVFVDNKLTVRSLRMSEYAGAAVISENEAINIEQFPPKIVFFFILPEEKYFTNEDFQLIKWGEKYKMKNIGRVYTSTKLFRVNNSDYEQ